jgi:hypothetical protein
VQVGRFPSAHTTKSVFVHKMKLKRGSIFKGCVVERVGTGTGASGILRGAHSDESTICDLASTNLAAWMRALSLVRLSMKLRNEGAVCNVPGLDMIWPSACDPERCCNRAWRLWQLTWGDAKAPWKYIDAKLP